MKASKVAGGSRGPVSAATGPDQVTSPVATSRWKTTAQAASSTSASSWPLSSRAAPVMSVAIVFADLQREATYGGSPGAREFQAQWLGAFSDEQRLRGQAERAALVAEDRLRETGAVRLQARARVEQHPLAGGLAVQVDGEVGVDEEEAVEVDDPRDAVAEVG